LASRPAVYAAAAARAFLSQDEFARASKVADAIDRTSKEGQFLVALIQYHNIDDTAERHACIEEMQRLSEVDWPSAVECRFHSIQMRMTLGEYVLASACISNGFLKCHPFQGHTALAWIASSQGRADAARVHAEEAITHSAKDAHAQEMRILADVFIQIGERGKAIDLLERIVTPGVLDGEMKSLITCAQHLGRHDLLMRLCRELRETGQEDDQLRRIEVRVLSLYAPQQCIDLAEEFIAASASPEFFIAYKNALAVRLERSDLLDLDPTLLPRPADLSPQEARLVSAPYAFAERYDDMIQFLYAQLSSHFNESRAHTNYISAILYCRSSKFSLGTPPETVAIDCAVSLEVDGTRRWVILENDAPNVARGEFAGSSQLALSLIGKSVGDTIDLPGEMDGKEPATIRQVQTKYVRVFQDCLENFRKRFPEVSFLREFQMGEGETFDPTPLLETLRGRRDFVAECVRIYSQNFCTVHWFAEAVGINEAEAIRALGHPPKSIVKCSQLSADEFYLAASQPAPASVVIDLSAMITLALVDGWDHLDKSAGKYFVSQSTRETVAQWVSKSKREPEGRTAQMLTTESGGLVVQEVTSEERAADAGFYENMQAMIDSHCECRESPAVAALEPERRDTYLKVLGFHHLESACLARDLGATVWSDDLALSVIAAAEFGLESMSTQLYFGRLKAVERTTSDDFNLITCKLIGRGYASIAFAPETIIKAAELASWDPQQWPFKECIDVLVGQPRQALSFLKLLRRTSCSEIRQSPIVMAILTAVGSSRAREWMYRALKAAFRLDPLTEAFLESQFQIWASSHFDN
jgi:hypothetical protein